MATTQDYIVAANKAKAKGDREAYEHFHQKVIESYGASDPTEGMGTGQKLLAGIGQGMVNIGRQAGNIVGMQSDEQLAEAAQRDAPLLKTGAGKTGAFIGEMAATAPLGGVVAGGARRVGAGLIRAGMAEGAAQGALTAGPGNRGRGAVGGAAIGAVLPGGAQALRRLGAPLRATKEARQLLSQNVRLTPGELNPTGRLNQWEQALQSSALGGASLREAREQAVGDWQQAAARASGPPGGGRVTSRDPAGMVRQLEGEYGQGYEQALGGYDALQPQIVRNTANTPLHTFQGPRGARGAMVEATQAHYPGRLVQPTMRRQIRGALEGEMSALPTGQVSGRQLQGVRSNIRSMARDTDVPGERALLRGGERKITESLESQIAPEDFQLLQQLDAKYGNFKILQDAVARSRSAPGGFTPFQLESSIGKATDLGEYARGGGGPLRKLSRAGRKVFEQRVQPTGERQVLTGLFGRIGTPLAAGSVAGLRKVPTKALIGTTSKQKALRGALRKGRRKYRSELQAGQSLGTNAMIQANEE